MAFRRSDLQEAFFVPGTHAFRVYGYGTTDPLEQVLAPGYFRRGDELLRPGDLIYVSICPPEGNGAAGEPRMALVMTRPDERDPARAGGSVRLVQDFGRATDPAGARHPTSASDATTPPKRGRGRPPGSKNRKPATSSPAGGSPDASS
jgi:hypothetical protein